MLPFFTAALLVTVLLCLLGAYWLLLRRSKAKTDASCAPRTCPVAATSEKCPARSKEKAVKGPAENSLPSGHPSVDPIHQFADGERSSVPFTCPFMAAFKDAKKKEKNGEKDSEENGESSVTSPALEQFTEMMAGFEEYRKQKEEAAMEQEENEVSPSSLVGHIKRLEQEKLILQLTDEEMEEEEMARRSQLAEIYALMEAQKDKFGINSVNEMQKQMRLYVS